MMLLVKDVLDHIKQGYTLPEGGVDELLYGDISNKVTGIAVMFMPTIRVLQEATQLNCNLILTHEGVFFHHWKAPHIKDAVYEEKEVHIQKLGMNIFRFHDLIHMYKPDKITAALTDTLFPDVMSKQIFPTYTVIELSKAQSLLSLRTQIKATLQLPTYRYVGKDQHQIKRIGLFVGYRGNGEHVIPTFEDDQVDLAIYGEGFEWETPEYVRDSLETSLPKSLIILGHYASEAPGMALFAEELAQSFPDVPVHYIDSGSPFSYG
ncbi:MAG: Nif3-like dinuclear metal center hexameric protein [Bacillota bacterium]